MTAGIPEAQCASAIERRIAQLRARLDKQDSLRMFVVTGAERIRVLGELQMLERFTLPDLLEQAAMRDRDSLT